MKKNMTTRSNSFNPVTSEIYTRTQGITALPPLIFKKLVESREKTPIAAGVSGA